MEIEIRNIDVNARGVPHKRTEWARNADLTDLICELLHRHDPKAAKELVSTINICASNEHITASQSNTIKVLGSYAHDLMTANYAIFAKRRKEESDRALEVEKMERQEKTYYTKLRNITDELLIEAMLMLIGADQPKI